MTLPRRVLILPLLVVLACKPSVGSSCDKGEARCLGPSLELECQGSRFIETPCRGSKGCVQSERGVSCDISKNRAGDPCSTDDQGAAVCTAKDSLLSCHSGAYAVVSCRGPKGCVAEADRAFCDTSIAQPKDACADEGLKACAADGSAVLSCQAHVMSELYACRGENGCKSNAGKLACDTSIAKLGDACDKKLEGQAFSCASDAAAILVCRGGRFVLDQVCKGGKKCAVEGTSTRCTK